VFSELALKTENGKRKTERRTMPFHRWFPGLVVVVLVTSAASAILIETAAGPVAGFLLKEDGAKLTVRVRTPDGDDKITEFTRANIKILHRIDLNRLAHLSRDNPRAYRDYAEELAGQDADPEARALARRLYLLAAKLDPDRFASSSLLAMSALANTPMESRRCRALAFLLDPNLEANLLNPDAGKAAQPVKVQPKFLRDFSRALQCYRTGQIKLAREAANRGGVDRVFSAAPGKIDQQTFLQWCSDAYCPTCKGVGKSTCPACKGKGTVPGPFGQPERCPTCKGQKLATCSACAGAGIQQPFPEDAMRYSLRAELWALDQLAGGDTGGKNANDANSWSALFQKGQLSPIVPLSLETITELDPAKCHFRNGVWVEP
jgi:hypothetical protein